MKFYIINQLLKFCYIINFKIKNIKTNTLLKQPNIYLKQKKTNHLFFLSLFSCLIQIIIYQLNFFKKRTMSGQIVRNMKKNTPQTSASNIYTPNGGHKYSNTKNLNGLSPQKTNHLSNTTNKMNLQNDIKNQEEKISKYQNLQNFPAKQNNQKSIKDLYKEKDYITMQETLGFLNFINTNVNQAFKTQNISQDQIIIPPRNNFTKKHNQNVDFRKRIQQKPYNASFSAMNNSFGIGMTNATQLNPSASSEKVLIKKSSSKQLLDDSDKQSQGDDEITANKKKLNKNRAIKRIIETAFGILQKNYRYADNQLLYPQDQKSTSTQFNIYLKQYNRIIQQINTKQTQQIQKSNLLYDKNQQQLQEVFQYTVMQDFRQKLTLVFSKQKISKNNVEMMIPAFRQGLVILKLNQLKIQFPNTEQPAKLIKMTEIENVEYFTQPYIFIVLTIIKDKTKSKENLYLRFMSQQNQDKWDRALYCCFMSRKMVKKERLFEIQFPANDVRKKQIQQFVKNQQEYQFDPKSNIIQKCFNEYQPVEYSKKASFNEQIQNNMFTDRTQYLHKKNTADEKFTISILNAQSNNQQFKRSNSNMNKSTKNGQINDPKNQSQILDDNFQVKNHTNNEPHSQQSGNLSKKSTFNINNNQSNLSPTANKNGSSSNFTSPQQQGLQSPFAKTTNSQNPFMKLMKIAEQQNKNMQQSMLKQPSMISENQTPQNLQRIRKLKRIREIQKNNVRGIVCQKQKFFMNKQKIIYFHDQSMVNSSRKIQGGNQKQRQQRALYQMQKIPQGVLVRNKYLQYWDYDYKKDVKQQQKLICVNKIQDFTVVDAVGGNTCSLVVNYIVELAKDKAQKKQLRLIFASVQSPEGNMPKKSGYFNKAYEICEWIQLVRNI